MSNEQKIVMKVNNGGKLSNDISIDYVEIEKEYYYKIENSDQMRPFFMIGSIIKL